MPVRATAKVPEAQSSATFTTAGIANLERSLREEPLHDRSRILSCDLYCWWGKAYTTVSVTQPKAFAGLSNKSETLSHVMEPCAVHCVNCTTAILYKDALIDALANNELLPCQLIVKLATP